MKGALVFETLSKDDCLLRLHSTKACTQDGCVIVLLDHSLHVFFWNSSGISWLQWVMRKEITGAYVSHLM